MKIKDIKELKQDAIVHTTIVVDDMFTKITKTGVLFYVIKIKDDTGIIEEVCVCNNFYYQDNIEEIDKDNILGSKKNIVLRYDASKRSFYVETFKSQKTDLNFNYISDSIDGVNYKRAVYNLKTYQEMVFKHKQKEINIVNIPIDKIETYQNIFNHIAISKRLVYKAGSIFPTKTVAKQMKLEQNRKILHDFKHTIYPCIANDTTETLKEQEIALLVLGERKRLKFL